MPTVALETNVDAPRARVFDLARSVDLHTASMDDHGEQAVDGVTEGLLTAGDQVTFRARHFGVPFDLTVEITSFDQPSHFRDELVSGPFASLRHHHRFESVSGGVLMRDEFQFTSPLGPLGTAVDALVLERYFQKLLRSRMDDLKRVAESSEWREYVSSGR